MQQILLHTWSCLKDRCRHAHVWLSLTATGQGGMLTRLEQLPEPLMAAGCSFLGDPLPDSIAR